VQNNRKTPGGNCYFRDESDIGFALSLNTVHTFAKIHLEPPLDGPGWFTTASPQNDPGNTGVPNQIKNT
jgi:hypothetical protein